MKLLIVTEDNKYLAVGIGNDRPEQIMVVDEKYQQSELLLDEIRQMLEQQRITVNDLEGIMVVNGPGDFSGLRIGVATANALAYGLGIRVVGVEMKSTWRKLAAEEKLEKIWKSGMKTYEKNKMASLNKWVEPEYGREPNIG
ncbi:TPA: tRNA (adenosine(37)-N6)-threonylcarbamoyltransferase complex dimerization subunit type 1 TsaB [Candidatus Falkowbacteria bacterium]|nr:tRNA (adenosine(37)-N6)-threonylcarbamoyltransferase complex dimerization subunit type 1 TsaB [Candidatus Falkowbacteria bacterium]